MSKSIKVHQKTRGRPPTGRDPAITVRLPQRIIDQAENWAAANKTSRSEAIRRLIEIALAPQTKTTGHNHDAAQKASKLAEEVVDKVIDKSHPPDEQHRRKRRLIKGPREFRNIRGDQKK